MKKIVVVFAIALALTLAFAPLASAGEKKIRIGFCMSSLDTFLSSMADAAMKEAAKNPNIEITLMDAQDDNVRQVDQVNTFLGDGVDVLLICIVETNAAPGIAQAAAKRNVPIVWVNRNPFYQREIPPNNFTLSSNSILEGAVGAEYLAKKLGGKGNIIILQGTLGHEAANNRTEGVRNTLRDKFPEMNILAEETGNWFRDQGMTVTENLITAYGDKINGVCSNNDEMALGALLALRQYGMNDVVVVGVDGTNDGIASVESPNGLNATAYQDPIAQGAGSVKLIEKIMAGEKVPTKTQLPVELITRENVKEMKKKLGK